MTTTNSHDAKSCFSSIFRRLLCGGGLPTHPSSDTTDHNPSSIKELQPPSTTVPAGIVARLMGLDSFPKSPIIMRKSRSLGSILDLSPNFEITKQQPPQYLHSYTHHRRSVSFREVTTTAATTTLSHDDLGKSHMGLAPRIQEKPKNLNNKKRQSKSQSQSQIKSQRVKVKNEEEKQVPLRSTRKQRGVNDAKKKVDHNAFPVEEEKKKRRYKSRNRTYNHPLPKTVGKHDEKKRSRSTVKRRENIEYSEEYCMKILDQVCKLTMVETEGGRGSVWFNNNQNQEQEIISNEISQQILQLLVYEMVDDLIVM